MPADFEKLVITDTNASAFSIDENVGMNVSDVEFRCPGWSQGTIGSQWKVARLIDRLLAGRSRYA